MLPKINRIKKKKDFEVIFKKAKSFKNNLFILKAIKNNLEVNRFGFVVSLKVSKKATVRNKIRRRMSEAVKTENIKPGVDVVLVALPQTTKADFKAVKTGIIDILKNV